MSLDDLRAQIDTVDDEILRLLEERAGVVSQIASEKRALNLTTYDPERERRVLERLAKKASRFPREAILAVYREVMSASVSLQSEVTVSFLGPEGTYSHIAARGLFGFAARYTEAATIEGVFDAVRRDASLYGVVPLENSTEGSVTSTVDSLLDGGALIRREVVVEVAHCLLSTTERLTAIERVYSHPQALAQCRGWLARNIAAAQLVQTASTVVAVREATADPHGAAIGSSLASELYGIPILRERIQDREENATRFALIAKEDAPRTGDDKTTLAFSMKDDRERGTLRRTLEILDDAGVNLTRIESRPSRQKAWDYIFIVDAVGHRDDANVKAALEGLEKRCETVLLLGSYPRWRPNLV